MAKRRNRRYAELNREANTPAWGAEEEGNYEIPDEEEFEVEEPEKKPIWKKILIGAGIGLGAVGALIGAAAGGYSKGHSDGYDLALKGLNELPESDASVEGEFPTE